MLLVAELVAGSSAAAGARLRAPDASQRVQRLGTAEERPWGVSLGRGLRGFDRGGGGGGGGGGTVQGLSARPDIFQIPRRGPLPLTSASRGCEGR